MIFLDTSAIYAWADAADPNHSIAVQRLRMILEAGEELLTHTHNYVLVESMALLQARLGLAAATKFAKDATRIVIEWVDEDLHASGIRRGSCRVPLIVAQFVGQIRERVCTV